MIGLNMAFQIINYLAVLNWSEFVSNSYMKLLGYPNNEFRTNSVFPNEISVSKQAIYISILMVSDVAHNLEDIIDTR